MTKSRSAKLLAAAMILFAAVATIASASDATRPGIHLASSRCVSTAHEGQSAHVRRPEHVDLRERREEALVERQGAEGLEGAQRARRAPKARLVRPDRRARRATPGLLVRPALRGRRAHRACWAQRSRRGRNACHRPGLQPVRRQLGERRLHPDASVHPARRWDDPSRSYLQRNVHDHRGRLTAQSGPVPRHTADGWRNGNYQRLRCRGRDGRRVHSERDLSRSLHHNRDACDLLPGSRWTCGDLDGQQRVGISVRRGC